MAIPFIPLLLKAIGPLVKLGGYLAAAFHLVGVGKRKVKLKAAEEALEKVADAKDAINELDDPDELDRVRERSFRD